jgi:hypothetical protein
MGVPKGRFGQLASLFGIPHKVCKQLEDILSLGIWIGVLVFFMHPFRTFAVEFGKDTSHHARDFWVPSTPMLDIKQVFMRQYAIASVSILVFQSVKDNLLVAIITGPHFKGRKRHDLIAKARSKVVFPVSE